MNLVLKEIASLKMKTKEKNSFKKNVSKEF